MQCFSTIFCHKMPNAFFEKMNLLYSASLFDWPVFTSQRQPRYLSPDSSTMEDRKHFFFLNVGHFLDHLFMLIFATVAALALTKNWELGHFELIPYATPGLITFGVFALPSGWLADR